MAWNFLHPLAEISIWIIWILFEFVQYVFKTGQLGVEVLLHHSTEVRISWGARGFSVWCLHVVPSLHGFSPGTPAYSRSPKTCVWRLGELVTLRFSFSFCFLTRGKGGWMDGCFPFMAKCLLFIILSRNLKSVLNIVKSRQPHYHECNVSGDVGCVYSCAFC